MTEKEFMLKAMEIYESNKINDLDILYFATNFEYDDGSIDIIAVKIMVGKEEEIKEFYDKF